MRQSRPAYPPNSEYQLLPLRQKVLSGRYLHGHHRNSRVQHWRWGVGHWRFGGNFDLLQRYVFRSRVYVSSSLCRVYFYNIRKRAFHGKRENVRFFVGKPLSCQCWPFKSMSDDNVVEKRTNTSVTQTRVR